MTDVSSKPVGRGQWLAIGQGGCTGCAVAGACPGQEARKWPDKSRILRKQLHGQMAGRRAVNQAVRVIRWLCQWGSPFIAVGIPNAAGHMSCLTGRRPPRRNDGPAARTPVLPLSAARQCNGRPHRRFRCQLVGLVLHWGQRKNASSHVDTHAASSLHPFSDPSRTVPPSPEGHLVRKVGDKWPSYLY